MGLLQLSPFLHGCHLHGCNHYLYLSIFSWPKLSAFSVLSTADSYASSLFWCSSSHSSPSPSCYIHHHLLRIIIIVVVILMESSSSSSSSTSSPSPSTNTCHWSPLSRQSQAESKHFAGEPSSTTDCSVVSAQWVRRPRISIRSLFRRACTASTIENGSALYIHVNVRYLERL